MPYVHTQSSEPNGGRFAGASGLQDFGLAAKYKFLNKTTKRAELTAFGSVGGSRPASNYLSDYMPYSLGLGAPEFFVRAIAQYKWNKGLYLRASAVRFWRGYTKAERDYYYNNGSVYSPWMDVPNANSFTTTAGYWMLKNKLKLEANYTRLVSVSGDDIRAYNAAQPTNKVEWGRLDFSAQYYFPFIEGLGLVANHAQVISGRNTGKMSNYSLGITYQFPYKKNKVN